MDSLQMLPVIMAESPKPGTIICSEAAAELNLQMADALGDASDNGASLSGESNAWSGTVVDTSA